MTPSAAIFNRRGMGLSILILASGGALALSGCDQFVVSKDAETQFLARRVDELDQRVRDLERQIAGGRGAAVPSVSSPAPEAGATAAPASAPPASVSILQSDEDRANILLLKAKQLQLASRSELPGMIAQLGISAPEIDQIQGEIRALETERGRIAGDASGDKDRVAKLDEQLDKLRYRLELASEAVRRRVIEEGRELSARLQAAPDAPAAKSSGSVGPR